MLLVETRVFTRQVSATLPDDMYRALQQVLAERPEAGALIRGSGGLRKLRWTMPGRGTRGGVRVIYYWARTQHTIVLLFLYPKNVQGDLSPEQVRVLRRVIEEEYP
jgi:mRNA-degrading endonuclease RelE of RelBE toxin-antitoxin system